MIRLEEFFVLFNKFREVVQQLAVSKIDVKYA